MTGQWSNIGEMELLAIAKAMPCPRCGTSNATCRVWAGGPGHTLGIHQARIESAREARWQQRCIGDDLAYPLTMQPAPALVAAAQNSHLALTLAGSGHDVTAA